MQRIEKEFAGRRLVIETGRMVLSGSSENLKKDDAVRRSYLGY